MDAAIWLAQGLALQLCTDCQLSELFHHEEFMLATLLYTCFKGQIEAILPVGADTDHWKHVLVYKVKELWCLNTPCLPHPSCGTPRLCGHRLEWQSSQGLQG